MNPKLTLEVDPLDEDQVKAGMDVLHTLLLSASERRAGDHSDTTPRQTEEREDSVALLPPIGSAILPPLTTPDSAKLDGAQVFGDTPPKPIGPAATIEQVAEAEQAAGNLAPVTQPAKEEIAANTVTPAGVELDGEGLPWDVRIHSSSKKKLAKKPHAWKKIRGLATKNPLLIEEVESELRALMAAPAPEQVTPSVSPTLAQPAEDEPIGEVVSDMPSLVAAITAKGIHPHTVSPVLEKHGIATLHLLAARPDLIPAVALDLGL